MVDTMIDRKTERAEQYVGMMADAGREHEADHEEFASIYRDGVTTLSSAWRVARARKNQRAALERLARKHG